MAYARLFCRNPNSVGSRLQYGLIVVLVRMANSVKYVYRTYLVPSLHIVSNVSIFSVYELAPAYHVPNVLVRPRTLLLTMLHTSRRSVEVLGFLRS